MARDVALVGAATLLVAGWAFLPLSLSSDGADGRWLVAFALLHLLVTVVLLVRLPVRRAAAALGLTALAAAATGVTGTLIAATQPTHQDDLLGEKLVAYREVARQTDTLFLGSSRTYRHLDPRLFDRRATRGGLHTRSFNLGAVDMRMPELLWIVRQAVGESGHTLRRLVLEPEADPFFIRPENNTSSREVRWHDLQTLQLLRRQHRMLHSDGAARWQAWQLHGPAFVRNLSRLGSGTRYWLRPARPHLALQDDRRGFLALDEQQRLATDSATQEELRWRYGLLHERLGRYRRNIGRLQRELDTPLTAAPDPFELTLFEDLMTLASQHDLRVYFMVSPQPRPRPNVIYAHQKGIIPHLLRYDDPRLEPAFFDPASRFDPHHLAGAAAAELTRRVADAIVEIEAASS